MTRPQVRKLASLGQALLSVTVLLLQIADLLKSRPVQTDAGSPAAQ